MEALRVGITELQSGDITEFELVFEDTTLNN
jgi:hypothetical protein